MARLSAEIDALFVSISLFVITWKRRAIMLAAIVRAIYFCIGLFKRKENRVMSGTFGVTAIIAVVGFGLEIGYGIKASLQDDGKVTPADFPKFMPAVIAVPSLISAIPNLSKEFMELDEADLFQVRDFMLEKASHIPGVSDKWLNIARGAFKIGAGLLEIVDALKVQPENPAAV